MSKRPDDILLIKGRGPFHLIDEFVFFNFRGGGEIYTTQKYAQWSMNSSLIKK